MFWAVKGRTCKGWVTLFKPPCPPWKTSILCLGGDWEKYGSVFHPHSFRDEIRRGNTILIARWWLNFVKQCQARLNILHCDLDSEQQLATSEKWLQKKNTATPDCSIWGECSGAIPGSHSLALQVLRTWIMPSDTKQDASSEEAHLLLEDIPEYSAFDVSGESKDRRSVKLIQKPKWKKNKKKQWWFCPQGTGIYVIKRERPFILTRGCCHRERECGVVSQRGRTSSQLRRPKNFPGENKTKKGW